MVNRIRPAALVLIAILLFATQAIGEFREPPPVDYWAARRTISNLYQGSKQHIVDFFGIWNETPTSCSMYYIVQGPEGNKVIARAILKYLWWDKGDTWEAGGRWILFQLIYNEGTPNVDRTAAIMAHIK